MIRVAVGLHVRTDGAFLVARRAFAQMDRSAGKWELPGGKVRPGEDPAATVAREFGEELGVRALAILPTPCAVHHGERHTVSMYRIVALCGEPVRNTTIHCAVSYFPLHIFAAIAPEALNDAMPTFMAALAAHNMAYGSLHEFGIEPCEPAPA